MWLAPDPNFLEEPSNLYYLCFDASPTNTFHQTGTPTAKTNYWLSVTVESSTTSLYFGWKSSATAYNDAAVAAYNGFFYPQPGDWYPMTDSQGTPLSLAFKITTATNPCPLVITNPANLTVPCGTAWKFTTPTAVDPCGCTNIVVLAQPPVTNGLCPEVITETWIASNSCNGLTATATQTVTVVSCVPAPSGMVLWLPFDEASGTNTANLYVGGNNGVLVGGPSHNLGSYVDNSLCFAAFTGVDQYVSVLDYPAIDPGLGQGFTLDAWIQRAVGAPNSPSCVVLDKRDPITGNGYSLSVDYGQVYLTLSGNNYGDVTDVVPADGQWHFVAVTVSSGASGVDEFYVDGHPPVSFTPTAVTLATTAPFLVGESVFDNHNNNQPWQGCIDEVEMFNRALSSNEVAAIFAAGSAGKCKSPKLVCSAPKSVPCGTQISFDPPAVNDPCCGTNRAVVQFGSDINGGTACTTTVTRTWLYVDCCGYSNFCSQTVTILPSVPTLQSSNVNITCGS